MPRIAIILAVLMLGVAGSLAPASAQNSSGAQEAQQTAELAAPPRPRITVRPRRTEPGPNSLRYCESWLATENRPSGTVITPQMRCWWQ
ncbi:MAG TPA: hypothetical protein VGJ01_17650 [Pseudolabrys sp.]|jgi:hypothetical protein